MPGIQDMTNACQSNEGMCWVSAAKHKPRQTTAARSSSNEGHQLMVTVMLA